MIVTIQMTMIKESQQDSNIDVPAFPGMCNVSACIYVQCI